MAEPWLPYGLRYRIASARPGRAFFHARSSFHVFLVCRAPTGPRAVVVRVIGVAGGCRSRGLVVEAAAHQGSGVLSSMVQANGLIVLHHDQASVQSGDVVEVMVFEGVV